MDYENVYYVDTRNATPVVVDHRTGQRVPLPPGRTTALVSSVPSAAPPAAVGWTPGATPYQYPAPNYYGPATMPNGWTGYPVNPPYVMPPVPQTSNLATILGGFGDIGTLANIVAQAFAAFLPLPAAPTPQDGTGSEEAAANAAVNSSNLIRYQNALALFARRDQQILTLGSVLKELFKRPGMVIG